MYEGRPITIIIGLDKNINNDDLKKSFSKLNYKGMFILKRLQVIYPHPYFV